MSSIAVATAHMQPDFGGLGRLRVNWRDEHCVVIRRGQMKLDDVYHELLVMTSDVGASLTFPIESEQFYIDLVEHFDGTKEQLLAYVQEHIGSWYRFVSSEPEWIQSPEWRFFNKKPMTFAGQIDIPPMC
jgi:hypothetical protein